MIALLVLAGCSTMTYHTASHDIALLEQKGDFNAGASVSMEETPLEYINVAYALSDHWALQSACALETFTPYAYQQALGYYTHLGSGIGEVYAGLNYRNKPMPEEHTRETRLGGYLQCDYGWNGLWSNRLDAGLGFRGSYVIGGTWLVTDDHQLQGPGYQSLLLAPVVMVRLGGEHLKLVANFTYSFAISEQDNVPEKEHPCSITLGINYRF